MAKSEIVAEAFAVSTDSDQEEKEVFLVLSQGTGCVFQHPSFREVVGMLLSGVHFSIHLYLILLTVEEKNAHFLFSFFFPPLSGALGGHASAMGREAVVVFHSFLVYTFTHQKSISFPPCKISRVCNKQKNAEHSRSYQTNFQALPACAQPKPQAAPLWVCTLWWALFYPKYQYLP